MDTGRAITGCQTSLLGLMAVFISRGYGRCRRDGIPEPHYRHAQQPAPGCGLCSDTVGSWTHAQPEKRHLKMVPCTGHQASFPWRGLCVRRSRDAMSAHGRGATAPSALVPQALSTARPLWSDVREIDGQPVPCTPCLACPRVITWLLGLEDSGRVAIRRCPPETCSIHDGWSAIRQLACRR